jgi:hypothetical protein
VSSVISKEAPLGQSSRHSVIVEIVRRNGEFKRHYGVLLGALLYLRSLRAAAGRSFGWLGPICALLATALPWLAKLG